MARKRLNPRQRTFVDEYLIDLNGTQAAIRAGYSPLTANEQAAQLLAKLSIKRAVREGMKARAARTGLSADKVIRELSVVAFSNVADYVVTDRGNLKVRPVADRGSIRAVSSFKRKVRRVAGDEGRGELVDIETEVRLWDKVKALGLLSQHLGLLKAPELPTLEAVFATLPAPVADGLRQFLAQYLLAGANPGGGNAGTS